jgi:hypothetical protein
MSTRVLSPILCVLGVLAASSAAAEPAPIHATYDKGVLLSSDDGSFALRLSLRNQFRFESTRPLEASEAASRFYVPRSRLQLEGHVFGEDTRYKLELGLGDRGSFSFVKDVYLDRALPGGTMWIRAGQWKRPFNRQELVSDFSSELNERANTAEFVGGGRDLGVAIHNDYEKSPDGLEWAFGVFNGFSGGSDRPVIATTCTPDMAEIDCTTPAPSNFPADFGPALVGRVGWNSGGIKGYSEGDLEGGPLRFAVGLGYKLDLADFSRGAEDSVAANLSHGIEADAMLKVSGFAVELGAYAMKLKSADLRLGALLQAGYFVMPKRAQIAARFAIAPTTGTRNQIEVRGAFNWYWQGHAWKISTDAGVLQQTGEDPTTMDTDEPDLQLRSMAQLTF